MDDSTLVISIDRESLELEPLVLYGHGSEPGLGVSDYTEPAMRPRIGYAPDSEWIHGSQPLSVVWQESILGFNVFPDEAESETEARQWLAVLVQAVGRLRYTVTVTVDDAPPETWVCTAATVSPVGGRTSVNLRDHDPVWEVTIPCQPIRSIG